MQILGLEKREMEIPIVERYWMRRETRGTRHARASSKQAGKEALLKILFRSWCEVQ